MPKTIEPKKEEVLVQAPDIEEKKEVKKYTPKVQVRSGGKISATLEGIAAEYQRLNPDRDCRWVYHSATKPELSNIMSRTVEGYAIVKADEFKGDYLISPFVDEKKLIRVADTVLMSIPSGQRQANKEERQRMANDQLKSTKDNFMSSMDAVSQGKHRAASRGAVKLEERDHEYEIEQRSKE